MLYVTKKDILGYVAMWTIRQSPFFPDNLDPILRELQDRIESSSRFQAVKPLPDGYRAMEFTDWRELHGYLVPITESILLFRELNLSTVEKEKGIGVDDPKRSPFTLVGAAFGPKPEDDFVDLDALRRNVCTSIEWEKTRG